jgi:hypothetical protein
MSLIVLQDVQSIAVQATDRSGLQDFYKTLIITDQSGREFQIMLSSKVKGVLEQLTSVVQ